MHDKRFVQTTFAHAEANKLFCFKNIMYSTAVLAATHNTLFSSSSSLSLSLPLLCLAQSLSVEFESTISRNKHFTCQTVVVFRAHRRYLLK